MLLSVASRAAMALLCLAGLASGQTSGEGSTGSDDGTGPTIGEEGEGSLGIQLGYYDHSDGGGDGNPFLDEDLTVIEPVIVFDYNVTDRLALGVLLSYDNVSSASIERLNDHPLSEQSGASGDYYGGGDFSLNYQWNRDWTIGGHAGLSIEYDYTSIGLGLNASQALQDADATMSYSVDAYLDSIDVIDYAGRNRGSDSRTSISGTVGWYQILSPTSHGTFGLTLAQQNGFLQTAYRGRGRGRHLPPEQPGPGHGLRDHRGAAGQPYPAGALRSGAQLPRPPCGL